MKFFHPWVIGAAALTSLLVSVPALADVTAAQSPAATAKISPAKRDAMVEGAMMCTRHFPRFEREYGIPTHLLSAIASTESGRYHEKLKIRLPWPWTIMSGGKGQFFDTKEQAVAAVKKLKAAGVKNIDVGCMQVNLYHHADAFANIEQAFEPQYNIAYAATFLRRLYDEDKSWKRAASDYHSKTPALGAKYIGMVYDSWFNIIEKLRQARLTVPASSLTAMSEMKGKNSRQLPTAKVEPYPVAAAKPVYTPPRMNSIKVSNVETAQAATPDALSYTRRERDNGVLVVRPDTMQPASQATVITPPAAPVTLADNRYTAPAAPATAAPATPAATAVISTAPVESLALTPNGSQATASLSVPLSGVTQAAVAPVTGLANAVMHEASASMAQEIQQPVATSRTADAPVNAGLADRRPLEPSPVAYKSGPNFIFSE